jgi:general secretion pathway protein M
MATLRSEASKRWQGMPARERLGATIALLVLGAWLVWLFAIQPALRTTREAPAQIDALDTQLQAMQRMAAESRELRGASPVPVGQSIAALTSATERLGDKGRISIQGDRATLALTGVTSDKLRAWLSEARSGARARPVDVQLTRGPQGYAGTVIVTLAGAQ